MIATRPQPAEPKTPPDRPPRTIWAYARGQWSEVPDTLPGGSGDWVQMLTESGYEDGIRFGDECGTVFLDLYEHKSRSEWVADLCIGHRCNHFLINDLPSLISTLERWLPIVERSRRNDDAEDKTRKKIRKMREQMKPS